MANEEFLIPHSGFDIPAEGGQGMDMKKPRIAARLILVSPFWFRHSRRRRVTL
jgi:hypothetical protein